MEPKGNERSERITTRSAVAIFMNLQLYNLNLLHLKPKKNGKSISSSVEKSITKRVQRLQLSGRPQNLNKFIRSFLRIQKHFEATIRGARLKHRAVPNPWMLSWYSVLKNHKIK